MYETQTFEAEIEKTQSMMEDMQSKLEASSEVLDTFAEAESIGDVNFDIENARIEDVLKQQKIMEANIADMIIGLEDVTNSFGDEFRSMQEYSVGETVIGFFSKQKAKSMHNDRIRSTSLAGNLQDLLVKSNTIVGVLEITKRISKIEMGVGMIKTDQRNH